MLDFGVPVNDLIHFLFNLKFLNLGGHNKSFSNSSNIFPYDNIIWVALKKYIASEAHPYIYLVRIPVLGDGKWVVVFAVVFNPFSHFNAVCLWTRVLEPLVLGSSSLFLAKNYPWLSQLRDILHKPITITAPKGLFLLR